jgi:hypothetical protein
MNHAAILSPIFNRHNLASTMREAFLRLFTLYPPLNSDMPIFERIDTDPTLSACLEECRIELGRVFLRNLFGACS